MGLWCLNEPAAKAVRLSSAALACAALADGAGNGNTAQQLSRAPLSSMSVQLLRASAGRHPLGTGLAYSPDNPGEWARRSHDKKTLRMAGLPHALTHAHSDARTAAVSATLEADTAGQASQLRAGTLSDMVCLRGCAEALASALVSTARPGVTEPTAVEFRANASLRLGEDLVYRVCLRPRYGRIRKGYPRPGLRCSVAHG